MYGVYPVKIFIENLRRMVVVLCPHCKVKNVNDGGGVKELFANKHVCVGCSSGYYILNN
jgi:hypothetical protein